MAKTKLPKPNPEAPSTGGKVQIRFDFNESEWKERANEHIRLLQQIGIAAANRKAAADVAKAAIKDMEAKASDMANQLSNGYEMRDVDAYIEFDRKQGIKHIFIHSPGQARHHEFIKTEPMTEDDYTLLPLPPEEKPKEKEPDSGETNQGP